MIYSHVLSINAAAIVTAFANVGICTPCVNRLNPNHVGSDDKENPTQ